MTKKEKKLAETKVERAYYKRCSGITINIMDIPKVFKVGLQAIEDGLDGEALEDCIAAYVETIRVTV